MEPNPENSTASSTKNSVSPPSRKRQKTLSDKYGEQSDDDALHQEEENKSHLSMEQPKAPRQAAAEDIQTFAAQCTECQNWRLISTKKKYEEIREHILEEPFICERAHEWNPDVTCYDPSDVSQEDNRKLWAIDKPGIPRPPPGWERFIKIRSEGKTQFADVHYKPPTGRLLRSLKAVEKYLTDHAGTVAQGVKISQFSFEIPAPLRKDYVMKRSQKSQSDASHKGTTNLQPEEAQPVDRAAASAHGDHGDDNEDQPQVVQYDKLPEGDDDEEA